MLNSKLPDKLDALEAKLQSSINLFSIWVLEENLKKIVLSFHYS